MAANEHKTQERTDSGLEALARALRMSFNLLVIVMIGSLVFFLWRSLFVVESNEVGILLRFGNVVSKNGESVLGKGPHFAWPYPVDMQIRVPTGSQTITLDSFWHNNKQEELLLPGKHGYTLTGDMNILHSQWTLRYRVNDPLSYALRFPDTTMRKAIFKALLRNAVVNTASSLTVDSALYDREHFRQMVRNTLVANLEKIKAGVDVEQLIFDPAAPKTLEGAFQSVTNAEEKRSGEISRARGDVQKVLAEAALKEGDVLAGARTQKAETIAGASADAAIFTKLYVQYKDNPHLFKKLYYEQKLKTILANVEETYIVDKRDNRTLYLELNPEPKKKAARGKK